MSASQSPPKAIATTRSSTVSAHACPPSPYPVDSPPPWRAHADRRHTNGAKEYAANKVTEANGVDLETATFTVGLGLYATPPATWQAPNAQEVSGSTATVKLLVDDVAQVSAKAQYLWVKVTDNPEVILLRAGVPVGAAIDVV
jgi:hypothetical protein